MFFVTDMIFSLISHQSNVKSATIPLCRTINGFQFTLLAPYIGYNIPCTLQGTLERHLGHCHGKCMAICVFVQVTSWDKSCAKTNSGSVSQPVRETHKTLQSSNIKLNL